MSEKIKVERVIVYIPEGFGEDISDDDEDIEVTLRLSDTSYSERHLRLTVRETRDEGSHVEFDCNEANARRIRDLLTAWIDAPDADSAARAKGCP